MTTLDNRYQIFINQTLQLAQTIVIKSSQTAESLNEWVFGNSGYLTPVSNDPTTWKYYLNLAGEYHSADQVMTVTSMDMQEEIIFNRVNLEIHHATARGYKYGSRQYTQLVNRYPNQEQLILGILYPTDINKAIMAKDGSILSYPPGLVESNEYNLMVKLQEFIDAYKLRWTIPAFDLTDELYTATSLGIMYLMLTPAIINIRLAACNTNEAHSFHVRQYLGSHGYLDEYVDALTTRQALYFYRNIAYIERNAGQRDTFNDLTDHIMTARQVPLAEYTMRHDLKDQPIDDYPTVVFRKKQLNLGVRLDPQNQISLKEMLVKQIDLAPANGEDLDAVETQIQTAMENSPSNVVATKALESTMVDESNSSPWILSEILFNHWMYLSSKNLYVAYINIDNPRNGEQIALTAKEAFIFAAYAFARSIGITPVNIPKFRANRVQRIRTNALDPQALKVDDIYSVVDHSLIDRSIAVQALSMQPSLSISISTDAFYTFSKRVYDAVQMQRGLIAQQEHHGRRGQVHAMVSRIYQDIDIRMEPDGTTYASWLSERNIDIDAFSREDFESMFTKVVLEATGAALHQELSLAAMQKAMVAMFTQLSSYGIHIIAEINDTNIRKTDWPGVRVGEIVTDVTSRHLNPDVSPEIIDVRGSLGQQVIADVNDNGVTDLFTSYKHRVESDLTLDTITGTSPVQFYHRVLLARVGVTTTVPITMEVREGIAVIPGIEQYLALPSNQQQQFKDIYNHYSGNPRRDFPLCSIVTIHELLPFDLGGSAEMIDRSIVNTVLGKTYPE